MNINFDKITNEFHVRILSEKLVTTCENMLNANLKEMQEADLQVSKMLDNDERNIDQVELDKLVREFQKREKWYLEWKESLKVMREQLPEVKTTQETQAQKIARLRQQFKK